MSQPRKHFVRVHPGEEAADSTEDPSFEAHRPTNEGASVLPTSIETKRASDSSVCDWLKKSSLVGNGPLKVPEVDTQAETIDDTDFDFISIGDSVNNSPTAFVPKHQSTPCVLTALPSRKKISITEHFYCATTEKDEGKSQDMVSSKRQSSSFLSSQYKPAQMPKSSPRSPLLIPRRSGFVFMPGRTKEEIHNARFLTDDDYMQLLAGVEHNWLVQRLMPTGIFKSKQLRKAYSKFLHSDGHLLAATGTPIENSLNLGFSTQCFSQHY